MLTQMRFTQLRISGFFALLLVTAFAQSSDAQSVLPAAPELLFPEDQDTLLVSELPVVLSWNEIQNAATYEAQVFADVPGPGDEPLALKIKVLDDTSVELPTDQLLASDTDSTYYWRVRGRNAADAEGEWSEVWRFSIAEGENAPPQFTFTLTAEQRTTDELVELAFTITALDPDGGAVSFTIDADSDSLGMAITAVDDTTSAFTWTPDEEQGPGEYPVTFTATDDGDPAASADTTVTLIVNEVNLPPLLAPIDSQLVSVNQELTLTASATDEDFPDNTLTYTLADTSVAGMNIDALSGQFSWAPDSAGLFQATVVVTDDGVPALSDSASFVVQVIGNAPPQFTFNLTAEERTTDELVELAFTITAVDPDGGAVSFTVDGDTLGITGAAVDDTTGAFTWTPTEEQGPGEYPVTFIATDDGDPAASADTTITLIVNEVNLPPTLAPVGNRTVVVDTELSFTAQGSDPDLPVGLPENTLTYALADTSVNGMNIGSTSGAFTWTPAALGEFDVTITVSDQGVPALSASETITITVVDDNPPPVFDFQLTAEERTTDELAALNFTLKAVDGDGGPVAFAIDAVSDSLGMSVSTLDDSTGAFTWTPSEAQGPGEYDVTFFATDDDLPQAQVDTTVTLIVNEVNAPPVLAPVAGVNALVGETVAIPAVAIDPDIPLNGLNFQLLDSAGNTLADTTVAQAEGDSTRVGLNWTPDVQGAFKLTVLVTDDGTPPLQDSADVLVVVPGDLCTSVFQFPLQIDPNAADAFIVELDTDPAFPSPIELRTPLVEGVSEFQAALDTLDAGTTYYWRAFTEFLGTRSAPSKVLRYKPWPATIPVAHTLSFPKATESADFRMISVPGQSGSIPIASTFPGQTPETDWRIFRDNSDEVAYPSYLEQMDPNSSDAGFTFQPGRGFWAISSSSWEVAAQEIPSVTLDQETTSFFGVPLTTGAGPAEARWTMIGNPFDFPVAWQDILDANNITSDDDLWDWTGERYVSAQNMDPYKGYYFFNRGNSVSINFSCFLTEAQPRPAATAPDPPEGVRISLRAGSETEPVSHVDIAWSEQGDDGLDDRDRFMPPAFFEKYRITLKNEALVTDYPYLQKEVRTSPENAQAFELELKAVPGDAVHLDFEGLETLAHREVYLFDDRLGKAHNLHQNPVVHLEADQEVSALRLLIGDALFIAEEESKLAPERFQIQQGFPNPFVDRTTIEYAIPDPGFVRLEVYNVLGQRVKTLVAEDQDVGRHRVVWDGTNSAGEHVASGMYMYVFTSGSFHQANPIIRVR